MNCWDVIHFDVSEPVLRLNMPEDLLLQRLDAGALNWVDLARPTGDEHQPWRRLFEIEDFKIVLPPMPFEFIRQKTDTRKSNTVPKREAARPQPPQFLPKGPETLSLTINNPESQRVEWFIQFEGTEFGPFSLEELKRVLKSGRLQGEIYLWNATLENWVPVSAYTTLARIVPHRQVAHRKVRRSNRKQDLELMRKREGRLASRQSLVATVALADSKDVIGVCANISEQGLQVMIDSEFEFASVENIRLRISPIGITGLHPFEAQVQLTWVNSQAQRAGFRFRNLAAVDQESLQKYLDTIRNRQFQDHANRGRWVSSITKRSG
jgi:hypothetical protein